MEGETLSSLAAMGEIAVRLLAFQIFLSAFWSKVGNFEEFALIVERHMRLGRPFPTLAAGAVVGLEAAAMVLLAVGPTSKVGAILAIGLLLLFAGAMALALFRGETELDCGCMRTALKQRVNWLLVVRNLIVAVLLTVVVSGSGAASGIAQIAQGIAAGIVLFILYLCFGMMIALRDSFADLTKRYG